MGLFFIGLHEEHSKIEANYIVRQEVTVTGCFAYSPSDFKRALDLLVRSANFFAPSPPRQVAPSSIPKTGESGFRFPNWTWLEERPLSQGPQAFSDLVEGRCQTPKIILKI